MNGMNILSDALNDERSLQFVVEELNCNMKIKDYERRSVWRRTMEEHENWIVVTNDCDKTGKTNDCIKSYLPVSVMLSRPTYFIFHFHFFGIYTRSPLLKLSMWNKEIQLCLWVKAHMSFLTIPHK